MSDSNNDNAPAQVAQARIKELRITGPMTANVAGLISTISRIENRVINMSMSATPKVRDMANAITDRYQRALRMFEDELRALNKDSDADSRPSNRRDQRQGTSTGKATAKPAATAPQAAKGAAAPAQSKNKSRNRNRRKGQEAQSQAVPVAPAAAAQATPVPSPVEPAAPAAVGTPATTGKPATRKNPVSKPAGAKTNSNGARTAEPEKAATSVTEAPSEPAPELAPVL